MWKDSGKRQSPGWRALAVLQVLAVWAATPAADGEEALQYRFERLWPALVQPWYFKASDIATDDLGHVYIADYMNSRVQKYTADGQFLLQWTCGSTDEPPSQWPLRLGIDGRGRVFVADTWLHRIQVYTSAGQSLYEWEWQDEGSGGTHDFHYIAVDNTGNVFISDKARNLVQKFSAQGELLKTWGETGSGPGQFREPEGMALDGEARLYVVDRNNSRIQRFSPEGEFQTQWGGPGRGPGQFDEPRTVAVDRNGTVYVTDMDNQRVQLFTADGVFINAFGDDAIPDGLVSPFGIAVDGLEQVYVLDATPNHRVVKFSPAGMVLGEWSSGSERPGRFKQPSGVAVSTDGFIYVTDADVNRVQKFSPEGEFIREWGKCGSELGQLDMPRGIAVDSLGRVHVADSQNHRIQVFTEEGDFIDAWGGPGNEPGQFNLPQDVLVTNAGDVMVADYGHNRIQRFSPAGGFLGQWGTPGSAPGQLTGPTGIAVNEDDLCYVVDNGGNRVQRFTESGAFVGQWGVTGGEPGQLDHPWDVAVDAEGRVLVSDCWNHRIQAFTPDGSFLASWGSLGSSPGQFNLPFGLAPMPGGQIVVCDSGNARVQICKSVLLPLRAKAIVVAGGGPFEGNDLWDATMLCANLAYQALTYQGLTKDRIFYISSDRTQDLDNNGEPDDVDAELSNENLHYALTDWASDADSLVLYYVDHGGDGMLRMSASEILDASHLAAWLDEAQGHFAGGVLTVIIDTCQSGSVLDAIGGPNRILIASAGAEESAYFLSTGTISFSSFFWMQTLNGSSVLNAFTSARDAMQATVGFQTPELRDPQGLAHDTYLGNGTELPGERPSVGSVTAQWDADANGAKIQATAVTDNDRIQRVWAVIYPPGFRPEAPGNAVSQLPSVELWPNADATRWENTFSGLGTEGIYQVAVYARDEAGNLSEPALTSVNVSGPLRHKALLIVGDSEGGLFSEAYGKAADLAHRALAFQGYSEDDILSLVPATSPAGDDGTCSLDAIENGITVWAAETAQDLVVYMVGDGGDGAFRLPNSETLTAEDLDHWLDQLQGKLPGPVVVVYDACQSATFLTALTPPENKTRIVIASAGPGEPARFLLDGDVSFSGFFWARVLNGASIERAFMHAKTAMEFAGPQHAQRDDDGDGSGNGALDGTRSRYLSLGAGAMLAGDAPLIGEIVPEQTLRDETETTATVWVDDVVSTAGIERVWAVITPPTSQFVKPRQTVAEQGCISFTPVVELVSVDGKRYEGVYAGFRNTGTYAISVYARDERGEVSLPQDTFVHRLNGVTGCEGEGEGEPDLYEPDDTFVTAQWIGLDAATQTHNLHAPCDQDWALFYAAENTVVSARTLNLGAECDTAIELYASDGATILAANDDGSESDHSSYLAYAVKEAALFYVRVCQARPNTAQFVKPRQTVGSGTEYDLKVYREAGLCVTDTGVTGVVTDAFTHRAVSGASVYASQVGPRYPFKTASTGEYAIPGLEPGAGAVWAEYKGRYNVSAPTVCTLACGKIARVNLSLVPVGSADTGFIRVSIEPAGARCARATWQIDGEGSYGSGRTVSVPAGQHAVSFTDATGGGGFLCCVPDGKWAAPAEQSVIVAPGHTAELTAWYTPLGDTSLSANSIPTKSAGDILILGAVVIITHVVRVRKKRVIREKHLLPHSLSRGGKL